MRALLILILVLSATGCQAQMQKWQRERTVEHLRRLKNYHGHISWNLAGEASETEIWFEVPNHFLTISKSGEILRSDGSTMEIYDPKTKFYNVFRNLPSVTGPEAQQWIGDLFDQSMKAFTFTLGPIGKVAERNVIELRSKPKANSVLESGEAQIFDEYSFPLASVLIFKGGAIAKYQFTDIAFNEKLELPRAKIPADAFKLEWDFNKVSKDKEKAVSFQNLKLDKVLKHETGAILMYYKNGAQFVSVIRYKNFGVKPSRGIPVKAGERSGFLMLGSVSNTLTLSEGDTTYLYSSNLLIDDLIAFASVK